MLDTTLGPPIDTSKIFSVHMSAKSPLKSLPQPPEVIPKVWNPRTTFEIPPLCPAKYSIVRGEGVILESFFLVES